MGSGGGISFEFLLAIESSVLKNWGASSGRWGFLAPCPMQEGSRDDLSPPRSPEEETETRGDKTHQGYTAQSEPAPGLTIQSRFPTCLFSLYAAKDFLPSTTLHLSVVGPVLPVTFVAPACSLMPGVPKHLNGNTSG